MRSFHTAACCSTNNITIFKSFRICNFCVVYLLKQIRLFLPFSSSSISLLVFSLSPSLDLHFHIVAQFSVFTRNVCFCVHTNAYAFKSHHLMECDFSQRSLSLDAPLVTVANGLAEPLSLPRRGVAGVKNNGISLLLCVDWWFTTLRHSRRVNADETELLRASLMHQASLIDGSDKVADSVGGGGGGGTFKVKCKNIISFANCHRLMCRRLKRDSLSHYIQNGGDGGF